MAARATGSVAGFLDDSGNREVYSRLLRVCGDAKVGRRVHLHIASKGAEQELVQDIVHMYLSCGCVRDAQAVFNRMQNKSVVLWTAMLSALSDEDRFQAAFRMFRDMHLEGVEIDRVALLTVLNACTRAGELREGQVVHRLMQEAGLGDDVVIGTALINMYGNCGSPDDASAIFKSMDTKNVVTWTVMVAAYARKGYYVEVFQLLWQMQLEGLRPNKVTFLNSLAACTWPPSLAHGRKLHQLIVESGFVSDTAIGNALVSMYSRCGGVGDALMVFEGMQRRDVIAWTAAIAANVRAGMSEAAFQRFQRMQLEGVKPDKVIFLTILTSNLHQLKRVTLVHELLVEAGLAGDPVLGTALLETYAGCGDLAAASCLFSSIPRQSPVPWSAMIGAYIRSDLLWKEALLLFQHMLHEGVKADEVAFIAILSRCRSLDSGQLIHRCVAESGLEHDVVVANALIEMYGKSGDLGAARRIFDEIVSDQDVVSWNTMIGAYAESGAYNEAMVLFRNMLLEAVVPDRITFIAVLGIYAHLRSTNFGFLGAMLLETGLAGNVDIQIALLRVYTCCGYLDDAIQLWATVNREKPASWNAMVSALTEAGKATETLALFRQMQLEGVKPDHVTLALVLNSCSEAGLVSEGRRVYGHLKGEELEQDEQVLVSVISMEGRLGNLQDAEEIFHRYQKPTSVCLWAALLGAFSSRGLSKQALDLIHQMQLQGCPMDEVLLAKILAACSCKESLSLGKLTHAETVARGYDKDPVLATSLVNMYSRCGTLEEANNVFEALQEKDSVSWTAAISAHVQHSRSLEALSVFRRMLLNGLKVDSVTFIAVLTATASLASISDGEMLHACIAELELDKRDVSVGNALITMYAKCGQLEKAEQVFRDMNQHDVVSWNALITALSHEGRSKQALLLFWRMQLEGTKANRFTFVGVLSACCNLAAVQESRQVQQFVLNSGLNSDDIVKSAFLNFYGKSGNLERALEVFQELKHYELAWNSMIASYAHNGKACEAFDLFTNMVQQGIFPDNLTFVSILSACSHSGELEHGIRHWTSMIGDHGIQATAEHYGCMVDIYGRSGRLWEAEILLKEVEQSLVPWMVMLGACRVHNDLDRGKLAAERIIDMEPENAAAYVVLSNMYANAQKWDEVARIRQLMVDKNVKKEPGRSWITIKNRVHEFVAKDRTHPRTEEIYAELDKLIRAIRAKGYVPDTKLVLHDVEEEQKERLLCYHSEKLAIAFGLLALAPEQPLTILKNLRVCGDCHSATKYICMVTKRKIVVRDARRFHHFSVDGRCSCGDYW